MSTEVMAIPTGTASSDDLNDSRVDNEVQLRQLVYQSLERDGLLARLKAQLRAAVFTTIDKSSVPVAKPSVNDDTTESVCRAVVLDWLQRSHLLYTEDVFKTETTGSNQPAPLTRTELLEQLHMKINANESPSILQALVDRTSTGQVRGTTTM